LLEKTGWQRQGGGRGEAVLLRQQAALVASKQPGAAGWLQAREELSQGGHPPAAKVMHAPSRRALVLVLVASYWCL